MSDSYTEYSHQGFGSRVGNSIKGVLFGITLFFGSFALLAWNEGRAVKQIRTLEEGRKLVVNIDASTQSSHTDGMLVFASGKATTDDVLEDAIFPVKANALKLRRAVKMYQWEEDKDTSESSNGSKKTTYSYSKVWSEKLIRSDNFHVSSGHQNPSSMPFYSEELAADEVLLGVHRLSPGLLAQIKQYTHLGLNGTQVSNAPRAPNGSASAHDGGLYYGKNPSSPDIGDITVRFEVVNPLDVSLVAQQLRDTFQPYQTKAGNTIELLETGLHDATYVFEAALSRNAVLTWALRFGGWLMMFFGLLLVMGPLTTIAGAVPFFGSLVGLGVGLTAFVLASVLSMLTVAVAWIFVRPLAGGLLLIVALACLWGMKNKGAKKIEARGGMQMPPPPPPGQAAA